MKQGLFAELKRRHVYRVAVAYVVVGWLVIEVATQVFPAFDMPAWAAQLVVFLIVLGFPVCLVLAWAFEMSPEGVRRTEPADSPDAREQDQQRKVGRALDIVIIGVLALALALAVWRPWAARSPAPATGGGTTTPASVARASTSPAKPAPTASVAATSSVIPEESIAVLPLINVSGDKSQQYFSDGLSENLIIALSQFQGLKVIGRTSSFRFRNTKLDARTIGRELGVAHLLEGSVQRAGDEVRVSAELIKAADGSTLWSRHYDRPYKNLFALQDDITRAVADALKARLLPGPHLHMQKDRPPSGNLDAYKAYLQGKFYFSHLNGEDMKIAASKFERATELDPGYAEAWARLAYAQTWYASVMLGHTAGKPVYEKALAEAHKALALAPDLADAHIALGYILYSYRLDWTGALKQYQRAVQLAPKDADAKDLLGVSLASLGYLDRAVELTRQALRTEPLNLNLHINLGDFLMAQGKLDAAEASLKTAINLQPAALPPRYHLMVLNILRGNADKALAQAKSLPHETGAWRTIAIALALQIGPDRQAANAALKKVLQYGRAGFAYQIAQIYAVRNNPDQAFAWLDRAWRIRDPGVSFLRTDVLLKRFQDDPRFAAICRKVGLPPPGEKASDIATH